MKKIFLDTNFVLDLLVRDIEYSMPAKTLLNRANDLDMELYISFLSVANFAYITRKKPKEKLQEHISLICQLFNIIPNNSLQLLKALNMEFKDYEDAIQYSAAQDAKCQCIITRNKKDFPINDILVLTPSEFISNFS